MSEVRREEPNADETPSLLDVMNKFEQDTAITRGALRGYLDLPNDDQQEFIATACNDASISFRKLTKLILSYDDMPESEKITLFAQILFNDDSSRVAFLNKACQEEPEARYFVTRRPDIDNMRGYVATLFSRTEDDPDDRADDLHSAYNHSFSADLQNFLTHPYVVDVESKYTARCERIEERKYLAKTAFASAVGTAVVTWLFSKRKS